MQIVEFSPTTLRFAETVPTSVPEGGFVWIYLEREELSTALPAVQAAAIQLGGSPILDLHCQDLANPTHPSHYDYTSVYDRIVFRRLATQAEVDADLGPATPDAGPQGHSLAAFARVRSRAVAFVVFDRLLISVHPSGCFAARAFIERYLGDAAQGEGIPFTPRSRPPGSPSDLVLRMLNGMVDSYLDLRRQLGAELDAWQVELLRPRSRIANWAALLTARNTLHMLQDLCEEQQDAMQEWLDTLRELPLSSYHTDAAQALARRDQLVARARDVMEHIDRVLHHARRLEQSAETAVQIHFAAQGQRTNDIMRTLTAVTTIFLPLNLFTGFFGMNFDHLPLIHSTEGMWLALGLLALLATGIWVIFRRRRYIAPDDR